MPAGPTRTSLPWTKFVFFQSISSGSASVPAAAWCTYYAQRTVVTPTNEVAATLNERMLQTLDSSTVRTSYSADSICSEVSTEETYIIMEFLHGISTGGLPPHELRLRRGALLILLRNVASHRGLCNGTRLVYEGKYRHFLQVWGKNGAPGTRPPGREVFPSWLLKWCTLQKRCAVFLHTSGNGKAEIRRAVCRTSAFPYNRSGLSQALSVEIHNCCLASAVIPRATPNYPSSCAACSIQ